MGYVPLPRSCFHSDEEYTSYIVWALSTTWSGRRWLRRRYGTARAVALISAARPAGGSIARDELKAES